MSASIRIAAALAAITLLGACTRAEELRPEEIRPVRVLKVGEGGAAQAVEFAGEVKPRHEIRLSFRVPGKIVERLVEVGSSVRRGQPIARLDAADLVLATASARAQAAAIETERNLAAAELQRYRELRAKNFISQAEFDRRASTLEAARARHEAALAASRQAANQAAYAVLVADAAGVVTAIEAEAGQVVAAGQTIARLARDGQVEVAFAVPESRREFVAKAESLRVTLNALPGRSWSARLRELSPAAEPVTRTYAGRATLEHADADVELGMSARIAAHAAGKGARIALPIAALHARGEQPQVFVVEGGVVRAQEVRTAGVANDLVAIASGLKPGDLVVTAGAALLRPGQRVRVLDPQ
jgi:multidrug efflux system membrane fusion protein